MTDEIALAAIPADVDPAALPLAKITVEQAIRMRSVDIAMSEIDSKDAAKIVAFANIIAAYMLTGEVPQASAALEGVVPFARRQ